MTSEEEKVVVVIFEWAGVKPPNAYYRHVNRLLRVWKRRNASSRFAVYSQESVFLLRDTVLAHLLAAIGEAKGCHSIYLIEEGRPSVISERDRQAVRALIRRWERPGPKPWRNEQEEAAVLQQDVAAALQQAGFANNELVRKVL